MQKEFGFWKEYGNRYKDYPSVNLYEWYQLILKNDYKILDKVKFQQKDVDWIR
ncbi:hypothetical protein ACP3T3_06860 [Chryseobacterium sp. CBSDS_008]|uniref:hypothetical protein n=1 Tax=Chryseobacterium sp. CBSDS_008 TaxID=3415265 RepID=UPI003CF9370F